MAMSHISHVYLHLLLPFLNSVSRLACLLAAWVWTVLSDLGLSKKSMAYHHSNLRAQDIWQKNMSIYSMTYFSPEIFLSPAPQWNFFTVCSDKNWNFIVLKNTLHTVSVGARIIAHFWIMAQIELEHNLPFHTSQKILSGLKLRQLRYMYGM